ncbi:hypothetical protein [Duganella sp.]|uniref:hypothetical protein n=1 Tax=Duganella sp. TaxID=1904440 RepID=UPI0031DF79C4
MKKICLLISLLALNTASATSGPDVTKYLAQRGWTAYDSKALRASQNPGPVHFRYLLFRG